MIKVVKNLISPNFGYEKLESPNYEDLVDVFEDRVRNWFFAPAARLLKTPDCQVAAVALLISYFEAIEIYLTGKDSHGKSALFFEKGFSKVFSVATEHRQFSKKIAATFYAQVRCGFAHDGMFRSRIFFSTVRPDPLLVRWPRKNGVLDQSGDVKSILVNPLAFYEGIKKHFDSYVKKLRDGSDSRLKQDFEVAVKLKWSIGEDACPIGMTEEEFFQL